ncbi:lipolytic enzyme, G-D-S-L [Candidatus Koribacter versatilis Ellin345]|uniref:Lipolytic enzyme, G-D-S-L n=1 Tax=Koribacter versatilis (strain Ellin345) TaxID=204669 RepID=Q1IQE4_KORVE|nr:SGNH/GDSL hydrolase family protein [Candidatus Koribacter versatilis]ABF40906.1 lipolytic enzyme, G-D-S-L [Candidatus Koribacter versatilis Ellin345]
MISRLLALILALTSFTVAAPPVKFQISPVSSSEKTGLHVLPMHIGGRVLQRGAESAPSYERQWPGTYFDTAFIGPDVYFKLGSGDAILKITLDQSSQSLTKPAPGLYVIRGLTNKHHDLRLEVITESQAGPTSFDGFFAPRSAKPDTPHSYPLQIEFIGDSHTVGYGNTSPKRECTEDEVWATTDTSQGIAPLVARPFHADYQVNAISGRGIVRNYNGFPGDTLPAAYPFTLLDHTSRYDNPDWRPQVIVVSLGTNDFSTPLHAGEKWKTRDELHADYEQTYAEFLHQLRARNPKAYFILWATEMSDGEILAEVQKVADRVRSAGEKQISVVPVKELEVTGCNYHPSLTDDRKIADAIVAAIKAKN